MRQVGLHLRDNTSLDNIQKKITHLSLKVVQFFVVDQQSGRCVSFARSDIRKFAAFIDQQEIRPYVHGSYWINLSGLVYNGSRVLERECALAQQLGIRSFILHPGTAKGGRNKYDGLDALARALNYYIKKYPHMQFVLENTAHHKLAVGSDLHDFKLLREKLDTPDHVVFCIDTAHAYAYGYDIVDPLTQQAFVDDIEAYLGIDNIHLIHLNDTQKGCGSYIDRHAIPGTGAIGLEALSRFCNQKKLANIPVLLELPLVDPVQEYHIVNAIRRWHE